MIYYNNTHEWINSETGEVGLSRHALDLLGDLVYLELPAIGSSIDQFEEIGVVESVKAASDLFSPVTGQLIWVNEEAFDDPTIISEETALFKVEFDILDTQELYEKDLVE